MGKDYYNILGVDKNASQEEIKKAFRKKAHQHHPDKGGDEVKFKEANEAFQVLGDPEKRKQFDQYGSTFEDMHGGQGFNWNDFAQGGFQSNINIEDLGDIFGDIFGFGGGSRSRKPSSRGRDIEIQITLDFKDAAFGITKTVELRKLNTCKECGGTGAEKDSEVTTCSQCNGTGTITAVKQSMFGAIRTQTVCPSCNGQGKEIKNKCTNCQGEGRKLEDEKLTLDIPAGVRPGMVLDFKGHGEAGRQNASAGDLYVHINIKADPKFVRRDDDIYTKQDINFKQAALGDKIEIETIHGPVILKIPEGTQTGKLFKLKGKGVKHFQGHGYGDHYVEVTVQTPTNLSKQDKKLLEEINF